jgi:hypothetical protein
LGETLKKVGNGASFPIYFGANSQGASTGLQFGQDAKYQGYQPWYNLLPCGEYFFVTGFLI